MASASPSPCAVRPAAARPDEGAGCTVHGLPKRQSTQQQQQQRSTLQHAAARVAAATWRTALPA
eukprot:1544764-Lingulodinium_polyedra.AAC.1